MHDVSTIPIQHAAQEIKSSADIHIGDVDMPITVRVPRLLEAGALQRWLAIPTREQAGAVQHAVNTGGADRHHIGVKHHISQASITLQRMVEMELDDRLLLSLLQPMIAGNPAVMLVDLAVPFSPFVIRPLRYAHPTENLFGGDFASVRPVAHVVDHLVADFMGNPNSVQSSP